MELLEREASLSTLTTAFAEANSAGGRVALVSGEAGIGKTTLINYFTASVGASARVLLGSCDPLFTPHPLAPLRDMLSQLPSEHAIQFAWGADRFALFQTFLQELQSGTTPTILIFEDIHWADESSLDLINFLCRRIQQTRCLIILTYRDDSLTPDQPLSLMLGHITGKHVQRISLKPLSEEAVRYLASKAGRADDVLLITCGNPFYVTEVLANESGGVPTSIRDAVSVRTQQLSLEARSLLELASVIPKRRVDRWLLDAILNPTPETLNQCATSGLVWLEPEFVVFRHELTRLAIAEILPLSRLHALNQAVLTELLRWHEACNQVSLPQIVHHARLIGDWRVLLRFAPLAAAEAAHLGSHREAIAHYQTMLNFAFQLSSEERAHTLQQLAYECYLTGQIDEAADHQRNALGIWQQLGSREKEGSSLRWLSRLLWFQGRDSEAIEKADQAISILEAHPHSLDLAMAYSNRAQLHMLNNENPQAIHLAQNAIRLAEQLGSDEILSHALNNLGTAQLNTGDEVGRLMLERSLQLALAHNLEEHVARAYTNLGATAVNYCHYSHALSYLDDGLRYCLNLDLNSWYFYMLGWHARAHLELGHWNQAAESARMVLDQNPSAAMLRFPAMAALAHLLVRQGSPDFALMDEAYQLAIHTREPQRIVPIVEVRAEAAWLRHDHDAVIREITAIREYISHYSNPFELGRLAFWLWRVGASHDWISFIAPPLVLQLQGEWRKAAALWEQIGCPYEQALALMDGDDIAQQHALSIFEHLEAKPAADLLRRRMRSAGIRHIPRGPRAQTQQNPSGLTQRQMDVLALLVEGLSDIEIAERLFISTRTSGHHVSAILSKLDVRSRQEAAVLALQRGWFSNIGSHSL